MATKSIPVTDLMRFQRQVGQANAQRMNDKAVAYFLRVTKTYYNMYKVPALLSGHRLLSKGWDDADYRMLNKGLQEIFEGMGSVIRSAKAGKSIKVSPALRGIYSDLKRVTRIMRDDQQGALDSARRARAR